MPSLFRTEAYKHATDTTLGEVVLSNYPHYNFLAAFMAIICVSCWMVAAFGSFSETLNVSGTLVPMSGYIPVLSPQAGFISAARIQEGSAIVKGQPLVQIEPLHEDDALLNANGKSKVSAPFSPILIRAPKGGIVTAPMVAEGGSVAAGQLIATIIPSNTRLQGEMYLSSTEFARVKVGDPVILRFDGLPFERFGQFHATVKEISRVPVYPVGPPTSNSADRSWDTTNRCYRVRLDLKSDKQMPDNLIAQAGASFQGRIIIEKRRIYQWIFNLS